MRAWRYATAPTRAIGDRPSNRGQTTVYARTARHAEDNRGLSHIVCTDETSRSACQALVQAIRYYWGFGIAIERVITVNGACYKSKGFAKPLCRLGIRHVRTKPCTPRTNGNAERFIQTALREWARAPSIPGATAIQIVLVCEHNLRR